jgi:hypothetical protein
MKRRLLLVIGITLLTSVAIFGQAGLTGKWQTDNAAAALDAEKNGSPAPAGGQAIIVDLKADVDGKLSGTVTEVRNPPVLNIESGMVNGKMITWVTQPRGVTWNLEMTDDNTLTLTGRVLGNRGGGGGGGTGGFGGRRGGEGAPPAGGPPAAGDAARGAAPGGDGAPRGAGGGGGRGFGRGPQQPIVLHRLK